MLWWIAFKYKYKTAILKQFPHERYNHLTAKNQYFIHKKHTLGPKFKPNKMGLKKTDKKDNRKSVFVEFFSLFLSYVTN